MEFAVRKKNALLNNAFAVRSYPYSDAVHGFIFMIDGVFHIVLNSNKSDEEQLQTKNELVALAYKHADMAMVLIHGRERKSLLAPYHEGTMDINIFNFRNLIENLNVRGVQND